ncbi:hypothetical protein BC826DRAFT_79913 [Russula brevipes]|nr:hypothetical protein BC826DRAFT_79913 [Russula brevipes]
MGEAVWWHLPLIHSAPGRNHLSPKGTDREAGSVPRLTGLPVAFIDHPYYLSLLPQGNCQPQYILIATPSHFRRTISLQQWARRDAKVTLGRYSLPEEARAVLVHILVFLFFAGFLVFVLGFTNTIFAIACCWIGLFKCSDRTVHSMHRFPTWQPWFMLAYFGRCSTQELSPEIDGHLSMQPLDAVNDGHDVEQFFEILGLCDSKLVHDLQSSFSIPWVGRGSEGC